MGFRVTAVDISNVACQTLRSRWKEKTRDLNVVCADYLSYAVDSGDQHDLVFSSGLLEELLPAQQLQTLQAMQQATSISGFILVKYCLEVKGRGVRVVDGFVQSTFDPRTWDMIFTEEQRLMRDYANGRPGEQSIRTGVFFAQRRSA